MQRNLFLHGVVGFKRGVCLDGELGLHSHGEPWEPGYILLHHGRSPVDAVVMLTYSKPSAHEVSVMRGSSIRWPKQLYCSSLIRLNTNGSNSIR